MKEAPTEPAVLLRHDESHDRFGKPDHKLLQSGVLFFKIFLRKRRYELLDALRAMIGPVSATSRTAAPSSPRQIAASRPSPCSATPSARQRISTSPHETLARQCRHR